jgi:hypothetical protein
LAAARADEPVFAELLARRDQNVLLGQLRIALPLLRLPLCRRLPALRPNAR